MIDHRYGPGLAVLMLVVGVGLLFNSLRGVLNREGMYDRESTQTMHLANIIGVVVGTALVLYAILYILRHLDLFFF